MSVRLTAAATAKRDELVVKLWNEGLPVEQIAVKTGLRRVASRVAELRATGRYEVARRAVSHTTAIWTDERLARIKELTEAGLTATEIALDLGGCTRNAVIGQIHRRGWTRTGGGRYAPIAPVQWTADMEAQARVLFMSGKTYRDIASELGVTRDAIRRKAESRGWIKERPPHLRPMNHAGGKPGRKMRARLARAVFDRAPDLTWKPLDGSEPRLWTERATGECCWPVGGGGAETLSCCRPTHARGWCLEHFSLGTVEADGSKQRRFRHHSFDRRRAQAAPMVWAAE